MLTGLFFVRRSANDGAVNRLNRSNPSFLVAVARRARRYDPHLSSGMAPARSLLQRNFGVHINYLRSFAAPGRTEAVNRRCGL
jgi:hypothetical protein